MSVSENIAQGIPLIMCARSGETTSLIVSTTQVSQRFATAALLMVIENGDIGPLARKLVQDLHAHLQRMHAAEPFNAERAVTALKLVLRGAHDDPDAKCNCLSIIEEMMEDNDEDVSTHVEYHDYVERLRRDFGARDFVCANLSTSLVRLLPNVPDYGMEYQARIQAIQPLDDMLVAYEYWDEDEDEMRIRVFCSVDEFIGFPAYDLAHVILEHGICLNAIDALPESNGKAREVLQNLI